MVMRKTSYEQPLSVRKIFQSTIIWYISSTLRCFFFSHFNFSETQMHLQLMISCNYNWLCFFFLAITFFKQCTLEVMANPRVNKLQDGWTEDAHDEAVASGLRKQRWEQSLNPENWNHALRWSLHVTFEMNSPVPTLSCLLLKLRGTLASGCPQTQEQAGRNNARER